MTIYDVLTLDYRNSVAQNTLSEIVLQGIYHHLVDRQRDICTDTKNSCNSQLRALEAMKKNAVATKCLHTNHSLMVAVSKLVVPASYCVVIMD